MNVNPRFQRLSLLTGARVIEAFSRARVLVFGTGGVGSWAAEALVRSGIGNISLVDSDMVEISNINRQIQATSLSIGKKKVEALALRLKEINPEARIIAIDRFFSNEEADFLKTAESFGIAGADYVIDAIDSLESKLDLIETAAAAGVTLFSSMGMARKLDPTLLRTVDIWESSGCPLARLVRQGLRKRGFHGNFTVVCSSEELSPNTEKGSAVFVTAAAGMILASLVIKDIIRRENLE